MKKAEIQYSLEKYDDGKSEFMTVLSDRSTAMYIHFRENEGWAFKSLQNMTAYLNGIDIHDRVYIDDRAHNDNLEKFLQAFRITPCNWNLFRSKWYEDLKATEEEEVTEMVWKRGNIKIVADKKEDNQDGGTPIMIYTLDEEFHSTFSVVNDYGTLSGDDHDYDISPITLQWYHKTMHDKVYPFLGWESHY